jgi:hypothetical protein
MEAMLREVLALDPGFPDGKRPYVDQIAWDQRFYDWEAGKRLREGREALRAVLQELREIKS